MATAPAYRSVDAIVAARRAAAVTLHDTDLIENTRVGVYVGGTGNLKVTLVEGGDVTFTGVPAGTVLPIQVTKCWATGSTATLVIALY